MRNEYRVSSRSTNNTRVANYQSKKMTKSRKWNRASNTPSNAMSWSSKSKPSYDLILVTLVTIPKILTMMLTIRLNAAAGTKICAHSYHFTGRTPVSIQPAPFNEGTPGVSPSSAGKRWCSTKYWSKSSFSRQRASSQSLKILSSWRGMSAMAKRRQCMFTDLGGRPWK